jgi:hypothetical protein
MTSPKQTTPYLYKRRLFLTDHSQKIKLFSQISASALLPEQNYLPGYLFRGQSVSIYLVHCRTPV